jgi:hypothetical protein
MPEIYENVNEFGKAIVEMLKPYFKGYEEFVERNKNILKLTGIDRNYDIFMSIHKSLIYEKTIDVSVIIEQKGKRIADVGFYIKDAHVVLHGTFKSKYVDEYHIYSIDEGFTTVRGSTLVITINEETRWIDIDIYD